MSHHHPRLRLLRLVLRIEETSAPYNQFSLAARGRHDLALCTFFRPAIAVPPDIGLFAGDNTFGGFRRALNEALADREYDVIHVHQPHVGVLLLLRSLPRGRRGELPPIVFTVHNSFQNFKLRNKALLLPMFAFADRVVCCGRETRQSFPHPFRWLAGKRLDCIPNGVDLGRVDRYTGRSGARPSKNEVFTVLSIGRLIPVKNPLTTLSAFHRSGVAPAQLLFLGDGTLRGRLEAGISRTGLTDRVRLTGVISRDAVYDHCLRAHLFVSTSRGEGLPIAVLEAMACRLPVVLSDIPPHREIAEGTDFIPLIPPDDADGFAHAIRVVAALSDGERAHIAARCRTLVEQRFSLEAMLTRYEQVYGHLAPGRAPAATDHERLERF